MSKVYRTVQGLDLLVRVRQPQTCQEENPLTAAEMTSRPCPAVIRGWKQDRTNPGTNDRRRMVIARGYVLSARMVGAPEKMTKHESCLNELTMCASQLL